MVAKLVERCRAAGAERGQRSAVRDLVEGLLATHGATLRDRTPARTVFETLHRSPELTVQHIVLPPEAAAAPHEHQMWAVVGVFSGREENTLFERSADGGLRRVRDVTLDAGDVLALDERAIHAIRNPGDGYLGAIHVYGGDLFAVTRSEWDATGAEHVLDTARQAATALEVRKREDALGRGLTGDEVLEIQRSVAAG